MRLELARSAGFCYGVRRAVQMAEMAAEEGRPCVMLGPIIHNRDVIAYLESIGVGGGHPGGGSAWDGGAYPFPRGGTARP